MPFLASLLVTITLLLGCAFGLFAPFYGGGGGDSVLLDVISLTNWDGPDSYMKDSDSEVTSEISFTNSTDSDNGPPRIAYLITGTKGDGQRIRRTLQVHCYCFIN